VAQPFSKDGWEGSPIVVPLGSGILEGARGHGEDDFRAGPWEKSQAGDEEGVRRQERAADGHCRNLPSPQGRRPDT